MRFETQTITVRDPLNRPYSLLAEVAHSSDGTPVGLAVHLMHRLGPGDLTPRVGEYTVIHLASGVRLLDAHVISEGIACRWLEMVAPLADWMQPRDLLRADETLRLQVRLARVRAYWAEDEETDVFTTQTPALDLCASSTTFALASLTAFLEWVSDAMEGEEFPPAATPALEILLAIHGGLAWQQRDPSFVVS